MLLLIYRWHHKALGEGHKARSGNGFEEMPDEQSAAQYKQQLEETNKALGFEMFTDIRLMKAEEIPVA